MTITNKKRCIFFDITDVIDYAKSNDHVSGIQRVQVRLISYLAHKHGPEHIFCSFWNRQTKEYIATPAVDIFPDYHFSPKKILATTGIHRARWPIDKLEVKKYLARGGSRGVERAITKSKIYIKAAFAPNSLIKIGINPNQPNIPQKSKNLRRIDFLPTDSTLVFLGANWNEGKLVDIGKMHRSRGGQVVQMIYDLIPAIKPDYFNDPLVNDFNKFLSETKNYVTKYACISNWTARDLRKFLENQEEREAAIKTTPLAHEFMGFDRNSKSTLPSNPELQSLCADNGFVLCVGTIEIRKNGVNLLKAWKEIIEIVPNAPRLVFAGKSGWKNDEFYKTIAEDTKLSRFVYITNQPTDQDIAFLYQKCILTVYPSFYEGWGLPIGESAWFGKLCIASHATSLPEVCGDLAEYIDPHNVRDISNKIANLLLCPEEIKRREERIVKSDLRTWDCVADDFHQFCIT